MSAPSSHSPRRVAVLGSTGSIGTSTLDVIERLEGRLTPVALSAGRNVTLLAEQVRRWQPAIAALADPGLAEEFRALVGTEWSGELLLGEDAAERICRDADVDIVLNGCVGAAGLRPSWATIQRKLPLALANKESLVIAGELLTREAMARSAPILPVDSEHNGLFQLLEGSDGEEVSRLILTASGGPFRERDVATFDAIRPEEALRHPTWSMGARITVDSATLLNKGFEVLEARWLFGIPPERIDVWIHPESIVHGFVEWRDGSTTAQLSLPDMRVPIQNALCYPERLESGLPRCDLTQQGALRFFAPEPERFPCLGLAYRALEEGGTAPAVLNAGDEVLVEAFLAGEIRFPQIAECLAEVLDARPDDPVDGLDSLLAADAWARREARSVLGRCR
ncbi:MAG: 1-deoxy-D-xylulose-5-phosphate reductoisomerase [Candidatus Eisenbacteria bacterium]|uniref:1-deoxy-D-xylulose 5-phosphate reductoisomerase n=1 Tax=Eiseniibacteriota bacterium TaxID=2212470 RepID=A0A956SBF5_UNCEI|nr:1-deoxy-D-xylulose-5-phosphate reductoisomerase [Candidatus Eisenbacteria bacterium]